MTTSIGAVVQNQSREERDPCVWKPRNEINFAKRAKICVISSTWITSMYVGLSKLQVCIRVRRRSNSSWLGVINYFGVQVYNIPPDKFWPLTQFHIDPYFGPCLKRIKEIKLPRQVIVAMRTKDSQSVSKLQTLSQNCISVPTFYWCRRILATPIHSHKLRIYLPAHF